MEMNLRQLKIDTDNHGNHFAMVENFVEKYIPIRIQSTISEALNHILPYKDRGRYAEFDKKKFAELHQTILEDDGIPRLAEQLKQIRMKMEDKQYIKLVRAEKGSSHHRTISHDRDSKQNDS